MAINITNSGANLKIDITTAQIGQPIQTTYLPKNGTTVRAEAGNVIIECSDSTRSYSFPFAKVDSPSGASASAVAALIANFFFRNTIVEHFADSATVNTSPKDLYSDSLMANLFPADGCGFKFRANGKFDITNPSGGESKKISFGGQIIADLSYTLSEGFFGTITGNWKIVGEFIRTSATTARISYEWWDEFPGQDGAVTSGVKYTAISSVDFTIANILKLTGQADIGTVTAQMELVEYISPV